MSNNYAIIMAGGSGTRFWPESRIQNPKQFLDILGTGKSLLQMTFDRLKKFIPADHIYVVAFHTYRELIIENLPEMPEENVIVESHKRNTAPCVLLSALMIEKSDPDGVLIYCPADHHIQDEDTYCKKLEEACNFARKEDAIVTLGIKPSRPATTYGYIKMDSSKKDNFWKVEGFVEKPNSETALKYLVSKDYLWNAGIFVWSIDTLTKAFRTYASDIFECLSPIRKGLDESKLYETVKGISVDYAIMEKADNIYVLPSEFGWSDVGTWNSLHALLAPQGENVILDGKLLEYETDGCLFKTEKKKLIVCKDLKNYVVIDMEDVLLIFPREQENEIKEVVSNIKTSYPDLA